MGLLKLILMVIAKGLSIVVAMTAFSRALQISDSKELDAQEKISRMIPEVALMISVLIIGF